MVYIFGVYSVLYMVFIFDMVRLRKKNKVTIHHTKVLKRDERKMNKKGVKDMKTNLIKVKEYLKRLSTSYEVVIWNADKTALIGVDYSKCSYSQTTTYAYYSKRKDMVIVKIKCKDQ